MQKGAAMLALGQTCTAVLRIVPEERRVAGKHVAATSVPKDMRERAGRRVVEPRQRVGDRLEDAKDVEKLKTIRVGPNIL